jgi:hypothetical protein
MIGHGLRAEELGLDSPQGKERSLLHSAETGSGAQPASYSMCIGNPFPVREGSRGVKLTTHLHPIPRLKMRGAMPPLLHTLFEFVELHTEFSCVATVKKYLYKERRM